VLSRRIAAIVLSMVMLIAACQATGAPSSEGTPSHSEATASQPAPSASGEPSVPDAGSTIDPDWVTRPALTCGDPKRLFPPEALAGLGLAELGLDPAAEVLRSVLAEDTDTQFPDSGWHRAIDDPAGVTFVAAGNEETPWFTVAVGMLSGTLQATEYGQCSLQPAAPDGVTFGEWWLDPDQPAPNPESMELPILVRETACASGNSPEGRILAPTIVVGADAIAVAIGIVHRPGGQDCQGNPPHPMTLVLPEPLGARALLDASQYPPRPVTSEDPG